MIHPGIMLETKSDMKAEQYKNEGNSKFAESEFLEALKLYNKALCYAQSKEKMALIYADRSAVYIELSRAKECLENMNLAVKHGYPKDKIQKLIERKKKCREFYWNQLDIEKKVQETIKLSYPPNPKVPFIVDCVEMRGTRQFGRGIYATLDMKAGDIIAIEEAIFQNGIDLSFGMMCNHCFKTNQLNLIPCTKSASLMFCSEKCRDKAYEKFPNIRSLLMKNHEGLNLLLHDENSLERILQELDFAFGGREELMKFIKEENYEKSKKTVFDYDLNDVKDDAEYQKKRILGALSLIPDVHPNAAVSIKDWSKHLAKGDKLLEKFLKHLLCVFERNRMNWIYQKQPSPSVMTMLYSFFELINHSCVPNAFYQVINGRVYVILLKPVKAGEQIFINYLSIWVEKPVLERQYHLSGYFFCKCYLCSNNLKPDELPSVPDPILEKGFKKLSWFNYIIKGVTEQTQSLSTRKMLEDLKDFIAFMNENAASFNVRSKEVYEYESVFNQFIERLFYLLEFPYKKVVPLENSLFIDDNEEENQLEPQQQQSAENSTESP